MGARWALFRQGLGAFKGVGFRVSRALARGYLPTFLIYQVTTACNSRCRMCGLWRTKPEGELLLKEFEDLVARPFFSRVRWVNLTGGEPFLRKDIVQLAAALRDRLPSLELVAIPTNGFLSERIEGAVREMLEALGGRALLNVNVSIDGVGRLHDELRGTPGAYKKAMRTLDQLMKLQLANERFETGTETVITDQNVQELGRIYATLKEHTPHVNITPAAVSPYYNQEEGCGLLSPESARTLVNFLEELRLKEPAYAYYHSKVIEILTRPGLTHRPFPCLGGFKTVYIDAQGGVYPCLMLPVPEFRFGNVREAPVEELWFSERARDIRRKLRSHPYCVRCTNNCDILNNLKEEVLDVALFMLRNGDVRRALYKDLEEGKMRKYL
ncbi:MAG: radical SAM protein [Thermoplasmata archaeon]